MLRAFSVLAVLACASVAQAGLMATSTLDITGFSITTSSIPRFDVTSVVSAGGATADLGGPPAIAGGVLPGGPFVADASALGSTSTATVAGVGTADVPPGADISTSATVDITPANITPGMSMADAGLDIDFSVTGGGSILVTFDFSGVSSVVTAGGPPPGTSGGSTEFDISLVEVGTTENLLDALNTAAKAGLDLTGPGAGAFAAGPPVLDFTTIRVFGGRDYVFSVSQKVVAAATPGVIPEPGTILAFGLLGAGAVVARRKRARKAAKA